MQYFFCLALLALAASYMVHINSGATTLSLLVEGFSNRARNMDSMRAVARRIHQGSLSGKTVLVSGGNRGLGSGIAAHLAASRARIVMTVRQMPPSDALIRARLAEDAAMAMSRYSTWNSDLESHPETLRAEDIDLVLVELDLASFTSIERATEKLKTMGLTIDVLINNAGLAPISSSRTQEGFELAFGVNFLGTVYFTHQLWDTGLLIPSPAHAKSDSASRSGSAPVQAQSTIIMVSSEEHRLVHVMLNESDKEFGVPEESSLFTAMDRYAYSKLALTTYSHELSRRWKGVSIRDICPGPVASEIARDAPWPLNRIVQGLMQITFPNPLEASLAVLNLADGEEGRRGVHWHMAQPRLAGKAADDPQIGQWIWNRTQKLLEAKAPPTQ